MTRTTTFRASNMIFPSEKIYKNIKNIDNILRSLYMLAPVLCPYILINCSSARDSITKFNHTLDKVEESINKIKQKVKIKEIADSSFNETFLGIAAFLYEAYNIEEKAKEPLEKRFVNLAIKLWDLGVILLKIKSCNKHCYKTNSHSFHLSLIPILKFPQ